MHAPVSKHAIAFWDDPDGGSTARLLRLLPGVWRHGDWAEITRNRGYIIYGRSDATLNPGGVRIGNAEIYRQVEQLQEVLESVAVGQELDGGSGDVRIVLFVKLQPGLVLDDALRERIAARLRENTTPLHVRKRSPGRGHPADDQWKLASGGREVINGRPVKNTEPWRFEGAYLTRGWKSCRGKPVARGL